VTQDIPIVKALTGHRGDDEVFSHPNLTPRPRQRGILPSLSVERTTDFTRFPTTRSRQKAIDDPSVVKPVDSVEEVRQAVGVISTRCWPIGSGSL
jgi:hypothetical protein